MRRSTLRRPILAGLIAVVLLLPSSYTTAGTADPLSKASVADATSSEAEAEALQFRATFGLEGGLAFVRAAAADPSRYSNLDYGVPLDANEVAEMQRRAEIQAAIDPMVETAAKNDTFGGMYLDQRAGGGPVFLFTADISERANELSRIVPASFGARVRLVDRTYQELTAVNEQIASSLDRLRGEGIDIVRAGIRTDLNVVEVGVTGLKPETSQKLEAEFGSGLFIVEDSVAQADACVSVHNCRPMKGGIEIVGPDGGLCTSGFIVETSNTSEIMMLTAGHCLHVHGGFGGVWSHYVSGGNPDTLGIAAHDTWHPGITRNGDVGLIDIYTSEVPTTKNHVRTTGTTVKAVGGWDSAQSVGDQTCRVGLASGTTCGEIFLVNVTRASSVPGFGTMTVLHTNEVTFDSKSGDSGGPMYYTSGAVIIAQGTHVHSDADTATNPHGWFTPISWGKSAMSISFGYDYSVCVTSSC